MSQRLPGPLHPENRGDSVAIDFIGLLPEDDGFDCILTFTNRLNRDIRIAATRTNVTSEESAVTFFNEWYCENGLP